MIDKEKFVEEIVQSEYEDAVHTNFRVPMETVVKRVAEQSFDAGVESVKKNEWHDLIKNPNDLPKNYSQVLTIIDIGDNETEYGISIYDIESGEWIGFPNKDILSWKEIE